MKKSLLVSIVVFSVVVAQAAILKFDLSPPGSDSAVGLSPLNETPPVTNSLGSGNEIGTGITFDTDTLTLNLSLGYGTAFGFTDLTGPAIAAHIHGPAPTNTPAGVLIDLAPYHVVLTNGGSIIGSIVLTTNQAAELRAGLYYVNIHTATNTSGEIRAQLIPTNALPVVVCPASTNVECTGPNGTQVQLDVQVLDADGDALTVVWSANGFAIATNTIAAGTSTNVTSVPFVGLYQVGTNIVTISVSDGLAAPVTCTTTVLVEDTIPPLILSASVTPNVLWPPNHKFVKVQASAVASDICGDATCKIKSITSSEPVRQKGDNTSPDWKTNGDLGGQLRAERTGKGNGRVYTLTIECTDESGNASTRDVIVTVPHDQGHGNNANTNAPGQNKPPGNGNSGNGNSGNGNSGNGNGNGKGQGKH
jgi:hypothetical protein